jgi:hypothetical protein
VRRQCRSFATTAGLLDLLAWRTACRCSHVVMEATGVYWKPAWNILSDGNFVLIVANAAHIKNVPGRKTDINDAMWIADLVACGLLQASFVPAESLHELRSLGGRSRPAGGIGRPTAQGRAAGAVRGAARPAHRRRAKTTPACRAGAARDQMFSSSPVHAASSIGLMMSPHILTLRAMRPKRSIASVSTGTSLATGLPRLVMMIGRRCCATSSIRSRQLALNSVAATCLLSIASCP